MGRLRKQAEAGPEEGANSNRFPPRKRSIPYGFDFDLDEVWAPNNPHLKHLKNVGSSGEKNKTKIKPSSFSGSQVFFFWGTLDFLEVFSFFNIIRDKDVSFQFFLYLVTEEAGGERQGVDRGLRRV